MVLRDDSRTIRFAQRPVQPLQSPGAQLATRFTGHRRVEHHQPHLEIVNGVLNEAVFAGQVRVVRKDASQRVRIVVIADDEIDRHAQRSKKLGEQFVFLDGPMIG